MHNFKHNLWQICICIDQLIYCIVCLFTNNKGWADMTLSAAAEYWHIEGVRSWPRSLINLLFFFEEDHCADALLAELERRHTPEIEER